MRPTQRTNSGKLRDGIHLTVNGMKTAASFRVVAIRKRRDDRNTDDILSRLRNTSGGGTRVNIVDINHRCAASLHLCRKPLLDRRIILNAAVPVDVVFRYVEQN